MLQLFKKIWGIYKPLHRVIVSIFVLGMITIGLDLVWPYIYGKVLDAVIKTNGMSHVFMLLGIAFGVMTIQNLVSWMQGRLELTNFDYDAPHLIQKLTFSHLFTLSIGQHRNEHSGLTQSVISDGQNAVSQLLNAFIYQIIPYSIRILLGLVALFFLSYKLALIVFIGTVCILLTNFISTKMFMPHIMEERSLFQNVGKKRMEILRNASLVISSAGEAYTQDFITKETDTANTFGKKMWLVFFYFSYLIRPFINDLTLVLSLGAAAYLVLHGGLSAGQVVMALLWTNMVLQNLGSFSSLQRQILQNSEKARKYFGLLDLTSDVVLPAHPTKPESIQGEIVFENVSFVYPKGRIIEDDKKPLESNDGIKTEQNALKNISFTIKAGEHVAFVGSSGAGKSTATLLLLRGSDPQTGTIKIDGIDLREIDLGFYRQNVGIVEQNIVLFDDTLRQNISFGLTEGRQLTDERLDELAKIARIDEFKDKLTNGWDTMLGENGIKLSGGQRQRVGIARALAKDPAILILDEATSSLDAKNEALIKDALKEASAGRTTIMVAHRLSTVKDADRIFVFDKGTIVGVGKHEELMKTCSIYADLVSHQTVLM